LKNFNNIKLFIDKLDEKLLEKATSSINDKYGYAQKEVEKIIDFMEGIKLVKASKMFIMEALQAIDTTFAKLIVLKYLDNKSINYKIIRNAKLKIANELEDEVNELSYKVMLRKESIALMVFVRKIQELGFDETFAKKLISKVGFIRELFKDEFRDYKVKSVSKPKVNNSKSEILNGS
jgi:hypothetical protein